MRHRRAGVVVQGVGVYREILVTQCYIIVEYRLTCIGAIFSPVRNENVFLVNHSSSFEEISHAIQSVVVQTVGV